MLARALGMKGMASAILSLFQAARRPHVLVVCTGNTCRSPMTAAYINATYDVHVESAGTAVSTNAPMSPFAVEVLEDELGKAWPATHRSRSVQSLPLAKFDTIICMEVYHSLLIDTYVAGLSKPPKVVMLSIDDPFSGDYYRYRDIFDEIVSKIDKLAKAQGWKRR